MAILEPTRHPSPATPTSRDESPPGFAAGAVLHHELQQARLGLVGELCPASAPVLASMLDGLVTDGIRTVIVDVSALRMCTSHGVDVLDRSRKLLEGLGGSLSIGGASGAVRTVLDVAGIDHQPA